MTEHGTERLRTRVVSEKAALIVIDMQNDFVSLDGKTAAFGFYTEGVRATVPQIRLLLDAALGGGA